MQASFFTLAKRENSTKQPTPTEISAGFTTDIYLLDDTSISNPTIRLEMDTPIRTGPTTYNYCYIPMLGRYYFIDDWSSRRNLWTCTCHCDVLATIKNALLTRTYYVERAYNYVGTLKEDWDYKGYNPYVMDSLYPSRADASYAADRKNTPYISNPLTGWYIIGVINSLAPDNPIPSIGGTCYYILQYSDLKYLVAYITGSAATWMDGETLGGLSANMLGLVSDPLQYIVSCKYFPRVPALIVNNLDLTDPDAKEPVQFGHFQTGNACAYRLPAAFYSHPVISFGVNIPLTKHPDSSTRGAWLNGNSHTERVLKFEPFGTIPLDSSKLMRRSTAHAQDIEWNYNLLCIVDADIISGKAVLGLYAYDDYADIYTSVSDINDSASVIADLFANNHIKFLQQVSSEYLIDIPLSQIQHNTPLNFLVDNFFRPAGSNALGLGSSFMSGGLLSLGTTAAGQINEGYWSVTDGLKNFFGPASGGGTPGSILQFDTQVIVQSRFIRLTEERASELGRPMCSNIQLSDIAGFCKCRGAEYQSNLLLAPEIAKVNSYLNTGFFIE